MTAKPNRKSKTNKKRYTRDEHIARAQTFRRFALTINKPEIKKQYLELAEYHETRAEALDNGSINILDETTL